MLNARQTRLFAYELKEYMDGRKITSAKLAQMANVNKRMAAAYVTGSVTPPIGEASALLMAIGYTPSSIDLLLGFKRGTAHDAIVDRWYADKMSHMRIKNYKQKG